MEKWSSPAPCRYAWSRMEAARPTASRLPSSPCLPEPTGPAHWHQKHDETFYVIAGTARFTLGDVELEAPAGTFVSVPTGAEHTFANPADEPAVILNTFTPDLYVGYFRDLSKLAATDEMTPEAILAVMGRYATYPAGTRAPEATD